MKSDWSKISKGDLITIHQAFESRIENEDGTVSIHLNDEHWSRCFAVMYEIGHELQRHDEQRSSPGEDEFPDRRRVTLPPCRLVEYLISEPVFERRYWRHYDTEPD